MKKKYTPQNRVGASRTKPMPERRSGANLPGPTAPRHHLQPSRLGLPTRPG